MFRQSHRVAKFGRSVAPKPSVSSARGWRARSLAAAATIVAFVILAPSAPASAAAGASFTGSWGWGVVSAFQTCVTSCESGVSGGSAGQLDSPNDVAINTSSGNLYVADSGNSRIDEFSSSGAFIAAWGWGVSDGASQFETCTASCQSGIYGGGAGQLESPADVGVNSSSGNVYVADAGNERIDEFSSSGSFIRGWGWGVSDDAGQLETCTSYCETGTSGGGAGQFDNPYGVAIDSSSGDVYVAEGFNHRVDEFSSSGAFITAWGWGVSDGANHFETCTSSCHAGIYGGGAGQVSYPQGLAVDASGNVYVADLGNHRVDEFSSTGVFTDAFGWGVSDGAAHLETCTITCETGLTGGAPGEIAGANGVAVDGSGDVFVADGYDYGSTDNERIDEFSSGGAFLRSWGWGVRDGANQLETCTSSCQSGIFGGGAGQFGAPKGLAVDSSGDVFVADGYDSYYSGGNNRIEEFSSSGTFTEGWGWGVAGGPELCTASCQSGTEGGGAGQFDNPYGVAVNTSSGNVYVADSLNQRIDEFSPSGTFILAWGWGVSSGADQLETCAAACEPGIAGGGAGQLDAPNGLAVNSSSGNVYVSDVYNERIDEFSSSGAFVRAWGWGVSDGANQLETCATSCEAGRYGGAAGELEAPSSVAVNTSTGDVYVAEYNDPRIDEYSSTGSFVEAWGWGVNDGVAQLEVCTSFCQAGVQGGGAGQLGSAPGVNGSGVAVDGSSGRVYVADTGNNRIDQFSPASGFIQAWGWGVYDGDGRFETCATLCRSGISGDGAGQLDHPDGAAVDTSGDVYVADTDNYRIDQFSPASGFIQAWGWGVSDGANQFETCTTSCQAGILGGDDGQLSFPQGLAMGSSPGNAFVADTGNQRIDAFTSTTIPVTTTVSVTAGSPTVTYGQNDVTTATETPSGTLCQGGAPNPYCKPRVVNPIVTCGYSPNVSPGIAATGLTTASAGAPAGTYATSCWGAYDPNYSFSYVSGTLTVEAAALTVTADNAVVTRGAPLPRLRWKANFVNHDTAASLSRQPVCTAKVRLDGKGRVVSPPGKYKIRCGGGRDTNYRIHYAAGQLRVVPPHAADR